MPNTKNIVSSAAVICVLFILFAAPEKASAQLYNWVPIGSYQASCRTIISKGASLVADCRKKSGDYVSTSLSFQFECEEIWNDNGRLKCTRNNNSALMQKARAAIDQAFYYVTNEKISNDLTYNSFLTMMFDDEYATGTDKYPPYSYHFFTGTLAQGSQLSKTPAVRFFNKWLNDPKNIVKPQIINAVFKKVYGSNAPQNLAGYKTAEYGYQDILLLEVEKLNYPNSKPVRQAMIQASYRETMGRDATSAEINYWITRKEYYQQIVDATRSYLYAPNGEKDLTETVKRALSAKSNRGVAIVIFKSETIKTAIAYYRSKQAIYAEMIK